jgi:hypothetical protein
LRLGAPAYGGDGDSVMEENPEGIDDHTAVLLVTSPHGAP